VKDKIRIKLREKYWTVHFKGLRKKDGECTTPHLPQKTIYISNRIKSPIRLLETCIHEIMHACIWDLSEEAVDEIARDMARAISAILTVRKDIFEK